MYLLWLHVSQARYKGLLSAVRLVEESKRIRPCGCPAALENVRSLIPFPDDNWAHRSLEVLALHDKGCTGVAHWTMYGLVILFFIGFFRVFETVTIRRGGFRDACFYLRGTKTNRRVFGEKWANAAARGRIGFVTTAASATTTGNCFAIVDAGGSRHTWPTRWLAWMGRISDGMHGGGGLRPSSSTWERRWKPSWDGDDGRPRWWRYSPVLRHQKFTVPLKCAYLGRTSGRRMQWKTTGATDFRLADIASQYVPPDDEVQRSSVQSTKLAWSLTKVTMPV